MTLESPRWIPLIYHLATDGGLDGSPAGSGLVDDLSLDVIFHLVSSQTRIIMSVLVIHRLKLKSTQVCMLADGYTIPTDGSMTESVTLVGTQAVLTSSQKCRSGQRIRRY